MRIKHQRNVGARVAERGQISAEFPPLAPRRRMKSEEVLLGVGKRVVRARDLAAGGVISRP